MKIKLHSHIGKVIRDIGLRFVIWVILDDVPVGFDCSKCPNGLSKPYIC